MIASSGVSQRLFGRKNGFLLVPAGVGLEDVLCSASLAPRCHSVPGGRIGAIWPPKSPETPILRAFPRSLAKLVFRGRTLLGSHQLAGRYSGFSTCDFNDLQKR
jgi:hypothetical protein